MALINLLNKEFPKAYRALRCIQKTFWNNRIKKIIQSKTPPITDRAESDFNILQQYPKRPYEYSYTPEAVWQRAVQRSLRIQKILHEFKNKPSLKILEFGCGDGLTAGMINLLGHQVSLTDMEDWRDDKLKQILPFHLGKIEDGLPYKEEYFDFIYSYNTFEHVEDPQRVISEIKRILQPDGLLYLDFGPIYPSAWGLHAYRSLRMPYAQYLFSESFIIQKLDELGIYDLGKKRMELQPLNKWRVSDFLNLFKLNGLDVIDLERLEAFRYLHVVLRYPEAFQGRNLLLEDLVTENLRILLKSN